MVLITERCLRQLFANQKLPREFSLQVGDKLTPSAKDFLMDRKIPIIPVGNLTNVPSPTLLIPVGVSNHHVHLSAVHFLQLFGESAELTELRPLSQPGQFAAQETVTIVGPKGVIQNVRILGPYRKQTQVEVSKSDGYILGIHPPVRLSGSIEGTPGITLVGPVGSVTILEGMIVAKNHVHMSVEEAKTFDVKNGDTVILATDKRPLIFQDVIVRVKENYHLDFHIDQDEANAAGLLTKDRVRMVGKNQQLFSTFLGVEPDG